MACAIAQSVACSAAVKAAAPKALRPAQTSARTFKAATVSNGFTTKAFMVWQPFNNKMAETFSYLPPLTNDEISRQVDYIVRNGWTPCLEFAGADQAYIADDSTVRLQGVSSCYQDNRYWTMWKLPMFGCTDPSQVLREISVCERAFPDAYVRLIAFDSNRQVQVMSFLVHRPRSATDYKLPEGRSVQG